MILLQETMPATHEAAQHIGGLDPIGIGLTVIAMSVVFLSLLLLYLVFKSVARMYTLDLRKRFLKKKVKMHSRHKSLTILPGNWEPP